MHPFALLCMRVASLQLAERQGESISALISLALHQSPNPSFCIAHSVDEELATSNHTDSMPLLTYCRS